MACSNILPYAFSPGEEAAYRISHHYWVCLVATSCQPACSPKFYSINHRYWLCLVLILLETLWLGTEIVKIDSKFTYRRVVGDWVNRLFYNQRRAGRTAQPSSACHWVSVPRPHQYSARRGKALSLIPGPLLIFCEDKEHSTEIYAFKPTVET